MGNRSSSSVSRLEYNIHMQKIEKELFNMQKTFNESFSEIVSKQKSLAVDMEKIQEILNEKDQLFDIVEENIAHVQCVSQNVEKEARKTKEEIGLKLRQAISKEKIKIDADIDEIKMRNTYLKDNVMELTTLDLAHERQLRDLIKRVTELENMLISKKKTSSLSIQSKGYSNESFSEEQSQHSVTDTGSNRKVTARRKSSFGSNLDRIDAAIKKLKENIKATEVEAQTKKD